MVNIIFQMLWELTGGYTRCAKPQGVAIIGGNYNMAVYVSERTSLPFLSEQCFIRNSLFKR